MRDYKKALNYSFLLLKYRSRSKGEIIGRLKKRGVSDTLIDKVVEYLQEYNYINDKDFSCAFLEVSLNKGWGPKKIEFALKNLKVSQDLIEETLKDKSIYHNKIRELIDKQFFRYKNKKNPYQKVIKYMLTRGFEYDMIAEQINNIGLDSKL
ncbi:MAG: RecX family transcriptional regulator [Candidatus Omnitrophota bacterium]|nr:RecX family transcriptional regulator [Candidatus Omnitrophota bacterium]